MEYEVKIGDKVECIETDVDRCRNNHITYGREYEVRFSSKDVISIINDMGHESEVFKKRFVPLLENSIQKVSHEEKTRLQKAETIVKELVQLNKEKKLIWSDDLVNYVKEFGIVDFN